MASQPLHCIAMSVIREFQSLQSTTVRELAFIQVNAQDGNQSAIGMQLSQLRHTFVKNFDAIVNKLMCLKSNLSVEQTQKKKNAQRIKDLERKVEQAALKPLTSSPLPKATATATASTSQCNTDEIDDITLSLISNEDSAINSSKLNDNDTAASLEDGTAVEDENGQEKTT